MADELDLQALIPATQAAAYAHVTTQAIINWRNRGHLSPATDLDGNEIRDDQGHLLYRLIDVVKADHATHIKARRA
jgi:hypothetical protein